jgi:hypothetical protein
MSFDTLLHRFVPSAVAEVEFVENARSTGGDFGNA